MDLKTKIIIAFIILVLVKISFGAVMVWMTVVAERKALAKKAAEREAQKQELLSDQDKL